MKNCIVLLATFFLASCQPAVTRSDTTDTSAGLLEGIASGKTQVIDLTHTLNAQNPYWPGEGNKPFKYEYFTSLAKDGVLEGHFTMDEHTGTHFDAPNHFIAGQTSLEKIPPDHFFVPIAVIDVRSKAAQ